MLKKILVLAIAFSFGFLTHALFFPDFLSNGITDVKNIVIPNNPPAEDTQANDPLITKVTFDGDRFSRHNITIGFTRYIQIVNTSETKQMELISTAKELTTQRGYGTSEAVQMQFNQKGQFAVADKNNPKEKLVITVK